MKKALVVMLFVAVSLMMVVSPAAAQVNGGITMESVRLYRVR